MEQAIPVSNLNKEHIGQLREIVGERYLLQDDESRKNFGHDETEDLLYLPEVVVRPRTTEEISRIMKLCNQRKNTGNPKRRRNGVERWRTAAFGRAC